MQALRREAGGPAGCRFEASSAAPRPTSSGSSTTVMGSRKAEARSSISAVERAQPPVA